MLFIALDPGTTTGWADYEDGTLALREYRDKFVVCQDVEETFKQRDPKMVQVVVERFQPRPGVQFVGDSLDIIGAVRYLVWKYESNDLIVQSPSEAKAPFSDKVLKTWGWWHPSDHARDAGRHLAVTLVKRKLISPRTGDWLGQS